jgi:hypothetical protein
LRRRARIEFSMRRSVEADFMRWQHAAPRSGSMDFAALGCEMRRRNVPLAECLSPVSASAAYGRLESGIEMRDQFCHGLFGHAPRSVAVGLRKRPL